MINFVKYLQYQGMGSRKTCTNLIKGGFVRVNGIVIEDIHTDIMADNVHKLSIDNEEKIIVPYPFFYIILHKPKHYETSHKPSFYPSVFTLLPEHIQTLDLQAIGRLDEDTTGLLLITNDGHFNHRLSSPKYALPKVYEITLKHSADERLCAQLVSGVLLHDDNETVYASEAQLANPHYLVMTIHSGKYHQVKRMIAAAGNRVESLHRSQIGSLKLGNLQEKEWRWIIPTEVE